MAQEVNTQSTPLNEGQHHAVVFAVNELGKQPGYQDSEPRWQYAIGLEFPGTETHYASQHTQWIVVNHSTFEKSNMAKLFSAAGMTLPVDDKDLDPTILIGMNMMVLVEHVNKDGRTYGNIVAFKKPPKAMGVALPQHSPDTEMPFWLQNKWSNRLNKAVDTAVASVSAGSAC